MVLIELSELWLVHVVESFGAEMVHMVGTAWRSCNTPLDL